MSLYPFKSAGQRMQGEKKGVSPVSMRFVAHYQEAPTGVTTSAIHAAITLDETETTTVTTGITNPDVARCLSVTGNAATATGNVVISGTNIAGDAISETIVANGTATVLGAKAFKTVTSIVVPVRGAESDTIAVGNTKKLGMPHKVYNAGCLLVKLFNGSADSGTLAVDADLEKNLFSLNGTPDGSKVVDLMYLI